MTFDRSAARFALPPVLALGLVAVLSNPLSAHPAAPAGLPSTGGPASAARSAADTAAAADASTGDPGCSKKPAKRGCPLPPAGNVAVGIPAVAFTETVVAVDGHLRAPVLLADPTVRASARVIGARTGPGCTAVLTQGVPAWLDCSIRVEGRATARILVTLSDGRSVQKEILAG